MKDVTSNMTISIIIESLACPELAYSWERKDSISGVFYYFRARFCTVFVFLNDESCGKKKTVVDTVSLYASCRGPLRLIVACL